MIKKAVIRSTMWIVLHVWPLLLLSLAACSDLYVGFATEGSVAIETEGTARIPIKLSRSSRAGTTNLFGPESTNSVEVTVPYTITGGTATANVDHTLVSGVATVEADSDTGYIRVPMIDDADYEGDETIILTLGTPNNARIGSITTHTFTIRENAANAPQITFSSASQAVPEHATAVIPLSIPITQHKTSYADSTINYTVSGVATGGLDHDLVDGTITIPAGSTSTTLDLNITDDLLAETPESIIITMDTSSVNNCVAGAITTHTISIVDNEALPIVDLATAAVTVAESVGTVTVTLNMDVSSALTVTVPYVVTGTAANGSDHNLADGNFVITSGNTSDSKVITITNDLADENNETIIVTIGGTAPTNCAIGTTTTVETITITDNDAPPFAYFDPDESKSESAGTFNLVANISAASGLTVTVPFTVAGTATNPGDHDAPASGSVTITPGNLTGSNTYNIVSDSTYEGNDEIDFSMGASPTNAIAAPPTTHKVTITNDDPAPTVSFSTSAQSVAENGVSPVITVTQSNPSSVDTTVNFIVGGSASGADHNLADGSFTITAGNVSDSKTVTLNNETIYENSETIVANIGSVVNATAVAPTTHTITVTNDDPLPVISFNAPSYSFNENVGVAVINSNLDVLQSGLNSSVTYTVAGTASGGGVDHNLAAGSISISAGQQFGTTSITITDDAFVDPGETIIVTMVTPTNCTVGGTFETTITINDNDRAFDEEGLSLWFTSRSGIVANTFDQLQEWSDLAKNLKLHWNSRSAPILQEKVLGEIPAVVFEPETSVPATLDKPVEVEDATVFLVMRDFALQHDPTDFYLYQWQGAAEKGSYFCKDKNSYATLLGNNPLLSWIDFNIPVENSFWGEVMEAILFKDRKIKPGDSDVSKYLATKYGVDQPYCDDLIGYETN